jgi:hypothetical protein
MTLADRERFSFSGNTGCSCIVLTYHYSVIGVAD